VKSLLEQVREIDTLGRAWRVICENGRSSHSIDTKREIEEFAQSAERRLTKIQRQLNRGAFRFRPAIGVAVPKKGKSSIRPLVIAPIESRIVQRAIHDVLLNVPAIRRYAENPYSFGGVRKRDRTVASVKAAIQAVLEAIRGGATYAIRSDISAFFTKIPKSTVTSIVSSATNEPEFVELFSQAITVELENLASLRERAADFPIHEIGVAQGNSLSPLLGNLLLYDFDQKMNADSCRCIRYVDDFIVLAPSRRVAREQFSYGLKLLSQHGLEVSSDREKSFRGDTAQGFGFLGIELHNGAIRPNKESRKRVLDRISAVIEDGIQAHRKSGKIDQRCSLIRILYEVSGIVAGWGHHYSFCNEKHIFYQLDCEVDQLLRRYLGSYADARQQSDSRSRRRLLGVPLLEELVSHPFVWMNSKSEVSAKIASPSVAVAMQPQGAVLTEW
jgi:retron-type reverse transcriptase